MKSTPTRFFTALFFAGILTSALYAQEPVKRCGTVEYYKQKEQNNPAKTEARLHANQLVKDYMAEHPSPSARNVVIIPVVVHVIYNINLQNIPDEQIHSQIDVLNRDFGRFNSDTIWTPNEFSSVAANTEIQFCLASQDPNNNPTTGIERRQNTVDTIWSNNEAMKSYAAGGLDGWPRYKYLNIWVCNLSNNFLGYTQLPGVMDGDSIFDGVVITSRAFGDTLFVSPPFHLGRTATHEVGHWLGLNHIWGDDGGLCPWDPGGNDDGINDTPPQGAETTGCPLFPVLDNCSSTHPGIMFMNYMDYTDDACMNMFTQEQADVMNATILVHRPDIPISIGCFPVGINEVNRETAITLYPNPADKELRIKNAEFKIEMVEIYDMLGQNLLSQKPKAKSEQLVINISSLEAGTYFLKITSAHSVSTARFTIAR